LDDQFADESVYLPLLCTAQYLHDGMTKEALNNTLRLIRIAKKSNDIEELQSSNRLLSKYNPLLCETKRVPVCSHPNCPDILQTAADGKLSPDQPCGHPVPRSGYPQCYVIQMPIELQLNYFLEQHGLPERPEPNLNSRSDIDSGSCYQNLREEGKINSQTITLQLNADGAKVFKSSKFDVWPLMAIINELPYRLRRSYVILLALWYGDKKPPANAFLDWAMDQLKNLMTNGIVVKGIQYKVRVVVTTTDTMARPLLLCTTQFNGEFGCSICLHPGIIILLEFTHLRLNSFRIYSCRSASQKGRRNCSSLFGTADQSNF
jgi:hypothetical protein